jgi:outer membrane lipoprotein-sorting protein
MPEAAGMPGKTEGGGSASMHRLNGKVQTRFRIFNNLTIDRESGSKLVTAEEILQTFDGEHVWFYLNQPENRKITKAHYDPTRLFHIGGRELFNSIFKGSDVELVGEEKVGEWDTYVIVSKPRGAGWSTKYWFDQATGVQVKLVETSAAGLPQLTMTTDAIDTNPQFTPEHFQMKIPEGFEFVDETSK